MIGPHKPIASLSSNLLARKGQARPAMRSQGFLGSVSGGVEDLGWNDMGYDISPPVPQAPVSPMLPPAVLRQREALARQLARTGAAPAAKPAPAQAITRQPEGVDEKDAAQAAAGPAPHHQAKPGVADKAAQLAARAHDQAAQPPSAIRALSPDMMARMARDVHGKKSKVAFTLRLDSDRHLRLRLASAITNRSAQQLVIEALDQFLAAIAEVDTLVRQIGETKEK